MTRKGDDIDWLVPFAILVALEMLASRTIVLAITYSLIVIVISFAVAGVWIGAWMIQAIHRREERPIAALTNLLWTNRTRLLCTAIGFELAALGISAFSELKSQIPTAVPFYADKLLADLDHSLFGQDAWSWFDGYFGAFAYPTSVIYGVWLPMHVLAFTLLVLTKPSKLKSQAIVAFGLMWLFLGVYLAYALSSVGPIFYDRAYGGHRFAELSASVRPYFMVTQASDYLWGRYASGDVSIGAGISAMPSLHVAGSLWLALIIRRVVPQLAFVGWTYLAVIYVGSVMLGWHYATDGLVGMAGTSLVWALAGQLAGWRLGFGLGRIVANGRQKA